MAPSRRRIPRRTRIFVGAEGESERSFAAWLQGLCEANGRHLHLDIGVADEGDCKAVVDACAKRCRRRTRQYGPYARRFVLLDSGRLEEDMSHGRDPFPTAQKADLDLVFLNPNSEGVLVRLHKGSETRKMATTRDAERALKKLWPSYQKPPSADALRDRFGIDNLCRAAKHDEELRRLATALGLISP